MSRGMSIHIGLNNVDPAQYGGWSGDLVACEFDAHDMAALAESNGFTAATILTTEAISDRVLDALGDAASELSAGDTLLLTYSGHGGQIPDLNGDEPDRADETWVLYDRQVIDDELYAVYGRFAEGVRIAVISDSCHSGSVTRAPAPFGLVDGPLGAIVQPDVGVRVRAMPAALAQRDFLRRQDTYTAASTKATPTEPDEIAACVMLISGCQDNQVSLDGMHNGLFTENLLTVWNGGAFRGSYESLHRRILQRMPASQSPRLSVVGRPERDFVAVGPAFSR
ncbi:MAG: caspase family protein [Pseudonocardia sp.]